ncbi:MAG TPA: DUF2085 domain-containing protein [Methanocella sp.]|uniref:DUF2085 domain-containing protein n=1 Tax=Methanocella sp. TaxID=2052833 RepID=UPI002B855BC6|nr:DUF2085 domain-containing protein [Methanocella sp.]HTY91628.1 DUF2085 domain-containing protein [Methanocella sp.]
MNMPDRYLMASAEFVVKHWLTVVNALLFLFIVPILLAPYFFSTGNPVLVQIAGMIMAAYHVTCHQLPERSLFIFGYEMAVCSRCFAIYVSFLAGGLLFYFIRNRLKPFHIFWYILICMPMAIDGFAQLFGVPIPRGIGPDYTLVWTTLSNNGLRIITGSIFGFGSAIFVLPYIQHIMESEDVPKKEGAGASADKNGQ